MRHVSILCGQQRPVPSKLTDGAQRALICAAHGRHAFPGPGVRDVDPASPPAQANSARPARRSSIRRFSLRYEQRPGKSACRAQVAVSRCGRGSGYGRVAVRGASADGRRARRSIHPAGAPRHQIQYAPAAVMKRMSARKPSGRPTRSEPWPPIPRTASRDRRQPLFFRRPRRRDVRLSGSCLRPAARRLGVRLRRRRRCAVSGWPDRVCPLRRAALPSRGAASRSRHRNGLLLAATEGPSGWAVLQAAHVGGARRRLRTGIGIPADLAAMVRSACSRAAA